MERTKRSGRKPKASAAGLVPVDPPSAVVAAPPGTTGSSSATDTVGSSLPSFGAQTDASSGSNQQQQQQRTKHGGSAMERLKRPGRKFNEPTDAGQVQLDSVGAVAVPGIGRTTADDSTITPSLPSSVAVTTGTGNSNITEEDPSDHAPPVLVAQLVPDGGEMERRLQLLEEERERQITVNAVPVDDSGIDPRDANDGATPITIMGLSKKNFWCLMVAVLLIIVVAGIGTAVVLLRPPSPKPTASSTVAMNQLWMSIGEEIDNDGGSWNTDPNSTQFRALDWLATDEKWRDFLQEGLKYWWSAMRPRPC